MISSFEFTSRNGSIISGQVLSSRGCVQQESRNSGDISTTEHAFPLSDFIVLINSLLPQPQPTTTWEVYNFILGDDLCARDTNKFVRNVPSHVWHAKCMPHDEKCTVNELLYAKSSNRASCGCPVSWRDTLASFDETFNEVPLSAQVCESTSTLICHVFP